METVFHQSRQLAGEMSGKNKMRKTRAQTGAVTIPTPGANSFMRTAVQTQSLPKFISMLFL